ncbi:hypothetical protein HMPREF1549_02657, partial [Actinomyces johnsonii F0510]
MYRPPSSGVAALTLLLLKEESRPIFIRKLRWGRLRHQPPATAGPGGVVCARCGP